MTPPQSEIQIVTLFRSRCRILCPAVAIVAVPNAAKRTQWAAQRAKREGMATGAPDIICIWPGKGIAWIEFKTESGKVSESQAEFLDRLERYEHPATVARSADEALSFLESCGAPFIGRIAA
jgi:hypothetical protein